MILKKAKSLFIKYLITRLSNRKSPIIRENNAKITTRKQLKLKHKKLLITNKKI